MPTTLVMRAKHVLSRILHMYADWRLGATEPEKRCHKKSNSILLTFDDFGNASEIEVILDILAKKEIKAMFFLIGEWATKNPTLMHKIQRAGHLIGNHTWSHPSLLKLSNDAVMTEIKKGIPGRWFRAPQGRVNRRIRRTIKSLGFALCYWTIDSRDWTGASVDTMRHTILSELCPGATILFHINAPHTRELLPELIDEIRTRGYTLTGMGETW
jgi:peptidoglycan/xylan/chitin deacetylase (PgdA/CDA1 family)